LIGTERCCRRDLLESHWSDSNRRPLDYESRALPLSYSGGSVGCPGADSNRDAFRHYPLKIACLPVSPPGRAAQQDSRPIPNGQSSKNLARFVMGRNKCGADTHKCGRNQRKKRRGRVACAVSRCNCGSAHLPCQLAGLVAGETVSDAELAASAAKTQNRVSGWPGSLRAGQYQLRS
jgi:hypothetical protein